MPKVQYQIYVIELSKRVFTENARFRNANPQFNGVLECLYVGMTSKTPKERFKQHKTVQKVKRVTKFHQTLSRNMVCICVPVFTIISTRSHQEQMPLKWKKNWHWSYEDEDMQCGLIKWSSRSLAPKPDTKRGFTF